MENHRRTKIIYFFSSFRLIAGIWKKNNSKEPLGTTTEGVKYLSQKTMKHKNRPITTADDNTFHYGDRTSNEKEKGENVEYNPEDRNKWSGEIKGLLEET